MHTQNSVQTIRNLFGSGTPTPPTIKITSPKLGESVAPGFPIRIEATDDNGIGNVEPARSTAWRTSSPMAIVTAPYAFNAPASLTNGTHTIRIGRDGHLGTRPRRPVQVVIGEPCSKPADCPKDTDTCIGGRCVTGPGCRVASARCATRAPTAHRVNARRTLTGMKHCVEPCALDEGQCPEGFGCLPAGDNGVCWPGYDDGSGGICSAGGPGGRISLGLAFAAMLFTRRRHGRE